ncbi:hypothetical protein [Budvicia aquatica]|uniref:Roadblock/LC7 domain-containing protein n=1 Tax=Budvicia aquatica TaxID=82979 RepID=A0A2C6DND4_9GAMM|nr:hypothetical protein [Budvicia aquatica]PHI29945.1 hypothetical protein CRN84_11655 [Budvicia aquatica]GKX51707.1 hypothetical protein SOASR029_20160 [Budvicia aquatica]VFS48742.1 Uncharacterised protein [Budvicia aquatica]
MSKLSDALDNLMELDGSVCAAVVDTRNGMILGHVGSGIDIEIAAAGNTDVLKAKLKTIKLLGLNETIEDILITLEKQYHILRPLQKVESVFIYLVLDKRESNLALARRKVMDVEASVESI